MEAVNRSRFIKKLPSLQNALDIFRGGWACKIPTPSANDELQSGLVDAFVDDTRPLEAASALGDHNREFKNYRILELGPLEAGHTYQLENLGADILAIESNVDAFLKCLIVKETLGLRSKFLLGDAIEFLEANQGAFDLIFASGFLYHLDDPIRALELIAKNCQSTYIWTHVFTDKKGSKGPPLKKEICTYNGIETALYRWQYMDTEAQDFWGGVEKSSAWMEPHAIVDWLNRFGFDDVKILTEDASHVHGPCISLYARKTHTPSH